MKKYFVKLMSGLLHSSINRVVKWYSECSKWIYFSFYAVFFFLSRKLCFFWSPCFLLIAELISLCTSGKSTVGFFLKILSLCWIICQSHLMNWIRVKDYWKNDDEFSWNNLYFIVVKEFHMAKNIRGFLENSIDNFGKYGNIYFGSIKTLSLIR